jgi:hypothetical protein
MDESYHSISRLPQRLNELRTNIPTLQSDHQLLNIKSEVQVRFNENELIRLEIYDCEASTLFSLKERSLMILRYPYLLTATSC